MDFQINTSQDVLDQNDLTVDDVKGFVEFLYRLFGKKYNQFLPVNIQTQDIFFLQDFARTFEQIQHCDGCDRLIANFNKREFRSHYFTARVASYLCELGCQVVLEPDMPEKTGPHPDIAILTDDTRVFIECKTSDISNFYKRSVKKQIADLVYEKIPTCDQITLYFADEANLKLAEEAVEDEVFVQTIFRCHLHGNDGDEFRFKYNDFLEVNVIRKPTIIGAEEDFMTVEVGGFLEDIHTNIRSIGFAFMRGGRSIGVYDVVDYENKLKDKREVSTKQLVKGHPNFVFIDGSDVVGDPRLHEDYISNVWLTQENSDCSGVIVFQESRTVGKNNLIRNVVVFNNPHATNQSDIF